MSENMNGENVDLKEYLDLVQDKNYLELYDYYSKETYMDILGVARQELPHSSFLRWLLDMHGEHGYSSLPMRKFLETVCLFREKVYIANLSGQTIEFWKKDDDNILSENNKDLLKEIQFGRYEILDQSIENEKVLNDQRRADIFGVLKIRFQRDNTNAIHYIIVLIENKVRSQEYFGKDNKGQTEKYEEDLKTKTTVKEIIKNLMEDAEFKHGCKILKLFVYLNAYRTTDIKKFVSAKNDGTIENKDDVYFAKSKEFITLNYQYVLDGIIEPLYGMKGGNEVARDRIYDYIRCLGQAKISSIYDKNDQKKDNEDEYLIMAFSGREQDLALRLCKNHFSVILPIIESLCITKDDEYGGFLLNENDKKFWISLSNLYRLIISEDEKDANLNRLKKAVIIVNKGGCTNGSRKHRFEFMGNTYESYTKRSLGLLCRDVIADYVSKFSSSEQEKKLQDLRKIVLNWNHNWLKEVILFDDEVERIGNDEKGIVPECKYPTEIIGGEDGFAHYFFSYMNNLSKKLDIFDKAFDESTLGLDYEMEIKLKNGKKAYVVKFWTADLLDKLVKYLDKQKSCNYGEEVIKVF